MKIGIDARFFGPRVGGGGIGRYVAELVNNLQTLDHHNDYVIFLKKENFHECKIENPRFYKQLADIHWYGIKEQIEMPKLIKQSRVDFMHYPHWNIPIFSKIPFLVTIHDLILLEDRHSARSSANNPLIHGIKYAGFRTILEHAVYKSRHILTVSEYSKQSILKNFRLRDNKITPIHNGIKKMIYSRSVSLSKMGVVEPYFLYVGNAYPHKNLEMLMHAFSQIINIEKNVQLVIAGRRDIFSRHLETETKEIDIPIHRLRFIDLPNDEEIATLYKHAKLFIFPSRLEGFGMPPLEAMNYKTPTAVSSASSLPEVCGKAANYFHPDDIEALVKIMIESIKYPEKFKDKIKLGTMQVKKYSWKKSAEKILDIYSNFQYLK